MDWTTLYLVSREELGKLLGRKEVPDVMLALALRVEPVRGLPGGGHLLQASLVFPGPPLGLLVTVVLVLDLGRHLLGRQ